MADRSGVIECTFGYFNQPEKRPQGLPSAHPRLQESLITHSAISGTPRCSIVASPRYILCSCGQSLCLDPRIPSLVRIQAGIDQSVQKPSLILRRAAFRRPLQSNSLTLFSCYVDNIRPVFEHTTRRSHEGKGLKHEQATDGRSRNIATICRILKSQSTLPFGYVNTASHLVRTAPLADSAASAVHLLLHNIKYGVRSQLLVLDVHIGVRCRSVGGLGAKRPAAPVPVSDHRSGQRWQRAAGVERQWCLLKLHICT